MKIGDRLVFVLTEIEEWITTSLRKTIIELVVEERESVFNMNNNQNQQ